MTGLRIGERFDLPIDAATRATAILSVRGAGKTYTGAVITEELAREEIPTVVIDPIGVWWGLRSNVKGNGAGISTIICGGDHGDVPLDESNGKTIADLVVAERLSLVLDMSLLSKAAMKRFVCDFVSRIYHKNRDTLHVMIDEADLFAPQKCRDGDMPLLGALEDLVRRGRARGLGVTLISQRSAVLSKDVLTQCETLIVLRTTHPRDHKAIDEWIGLHGSETARAEVMKSLPTMKTGEAWVWSPPLDILKRVQIRRRYTFDSSATPKPGQARISPKARADVDLEAIRTRLSESIEKVREEDPKELRKRLIAMSKDLTQARAEIARLNAHTCPEPEPTIDVPPELVDKMRSWHQSMLDLGEEIRSMGVRIIDLRGAKPAKREPKRANKPQPIYPGVIPIDKHLTTSDGLFTDIRESSDGDKTLRKGQRTMLSVLASMPMPLTQVQLATLARLSYKSGTFKSYLSSLRTEKYIYTSIEQGVNEDPVIHLTAAGRTAAGDPLPVPTSRELQALWASRLRAGARRMLETVIEFYPRDISIEELGRATDMATSSGTFKSYLSMLKTNGLVDRWADRVAASPTLFLGSAA